MAHFVGSQAVNVFPFPSFFDPFDCSASIGELQKPCFKWRVCVSRGIVGSERGKHKGTRHGRSFRILPIEALKSNSTKKEEEGKKR
jgi:hypothetical protein